MSSRYVRMHMKLIVLINTQQDRAQHVLKPSTPAVIVVSRRDQSVVPIDGFLVVMRVTKFYHVVCIDVLFLAIVVC
jgi:hypothetical protein